MSPRIKQLDRKPPRVTRRDFKKYVDAKRRQNMKAIYLERKGEAESLVAGEIPQPSPKEGEVLVKVCATAVMPTEFQWFTTFSKPSGEPRPFPIVLSHEFSGVVGAVGTRGNGLSVGDKVYGLNDWFINGAQAEYCVVEPAALARKPQSIDHVQSAVVPISALTAWQGLFEKAKLERGQRILIHGAAGGVGSFAVQMAHWGGAYIIAPVSSSNFEFVRSLGADEVIDYRTTRFEDVVREVNIVFDAVGGETLERSWAVLAKSGRVVSIADKSEGATEQRVRDAFMLVRADGSQLAQITNLIDAGKLRVFVGKVFPLAEAREAYAQARQGGQRGKIALRVFE
jgi:NADPH:quinone reductase-like Zn-dependent oxidoreductase